jgi:SRSO17 transposase
MPTTIVAATCPVPACNLAPRDVESLVADLAAYTEQFQSAFTRKDQAPWAHRYLQGLVSDQPRKSIEPMALAHDFPIRSMQAFIGESPWSSAPLLHQHQQVVAQTLGEDDAVLLVDESGMPKQGQHSAAVAHQ